MFANLLSEFCYWEGNPNGYPNEKGAPFTQWREKTQRFMWFFVYVTCINVLMKNMILIHSLSYMWRFLPTIFVFASCQILWHTFPPPLGPNPFSAFETPVPRCWGEYWLRVNWNSSNIWNEPKSEDSKMRRKVEICKKSWNRIPKRFLCYQFVNSPETGKNKLQDSFFGAKWPTSYALASCTMENTATLRLHREDT